MNYRYSSEAEPAIVVLRCRRLTGHQSTWRKMAPDQGQLRKTSCICGIVFSIVITATITDTKKKKNRSPWFAISLQETSHRLFLLIMIKNMAALDCLAHFTCPTHFTAFSWDSFDIQCWINAFVWHGRCTGALLVLQEAIFAFHNNSTRRICKSLAVG